MSLSKRKGGKVFVQECTLEFLPITVSVQECNLVFLQIEFYAHEF